MAVGSVCRNADKEDVASRVLEDLEENFPGFDYFVLVNSFQISVVLFFGKLVKKTIKISKVIFGDQKLVPNIYLILFR